MRDYGVPEGLPTPEEMWEKLTGQKDTSFKTEQIYTDFKLEGFQRAMGKAIQQKVGGIDE